MSNFHRIEASIRRELLNYLESISDPAPYAAIDSTINDTLDDIGKMLAQKFRGRAYHLLKGKIDDCDESLHRLGQDYILPRK